MGLGVEVLAHGRRGTLEVVLDPPVSSSVGTLGPQAGMNRTEPSSSVERAFILCLV